MWHPIVDAPIMQWAYITITFNLVDISRVQKILYTELNANRETHKALHFLFFGLHQNYVHTLSGFFSCKYMCIVDCPWLSLIIFSCSIYLYYQFNLCYINCKYRIIWRFLLQVSYNIGNINMTDWDKLKWLKFVRV